MRPVPQTAAALAGTVCLLALAAAPAVAADAEASPRLLDPGATVTVVVSCDPVATSIPGTLDASSPAFARGTVKLTRVGDQESAVAADGAVAPSYRGKARLARAAQFVAPGEDAGGVRTQEWGVDGLCPGGEQWAASFRVDVEGATASARGDRAAAGRTEETGRTGSAETTEQTADHDAGAGEDTGSSGGVEAKGGARAAESPGSPVRTGVGGSVGGTSSEVALVAGGSALLLAGVGAAVVLRRRATRAG